MSTFTPKLFTILKNGYSKDDFRNDVISGLTVAIVALPLSMALAIASGASPDKGLITAVIAGFLISFLGGSRVQVGGPTGAFVVVVFNVIAQHGYDGLILATLIAGAILIIVGYSKLGQIIKFIPHPVITGFTAGIAVIIASSQVQDFLGLKIAKVPADFIPKWIAYFNSIGTYSIATLIIGALSLFIILSLKRYAPKLPGYLIAVIVVSLIVVIFKLPVETIGSKFPNMPTEFPMPHLPTWNIEKVINIIPSAFTIAFLAGIEALLSAVVADGMTGYKHRSNQELVGLGFANIGSSLFGGLPATGAIARTATNIKSGAKSPVAGMSHAIFLLIFMLFAMKLIAFIPLATLAAILFIVAWNMSEIHNFIHIFKLSRTDRSIMLLTFVLTILVNLSVAIGVGITLACLIFMKRMSDAVEVKSEWRKSDKLYDEDSEYEAQRKELPDNIEVFQITGPLFFGVANNFVEALKSMGQMPKVFILRMRLVPYLDASGEKALETVIKQCRNNGTHVILSGLQKQPLRMLKNAHIDDGKNNVWFAPHYEEAIKKAKELINVQNI
ncbi:MAG: sulfate permease [Francisella sp.]